MMSIRVLAAGLAAGIAVVAARGGAGDALLAASTQAHASPAAAQLRLEGEYGLWVEERGGRVHVRWLTRTEAPGQLEVYRGGRRLHGLRTPAGYAHTASFRRPLGRGVMLDYGSAADTTDRHRTEIRLGTPLRAPTSVSGADSIFVIADIHGEHDQMIRLLQNAGVIDAQQRWSAGRAHFVQLGDIFDRGPDAIRTLWYLYDLERQAVAAGGGLHVLLGNHEIMVLLGDLRYLAPKDQLIAELYGVDFSRLFDVRHSVLGRWLASKPAAMRVDDVVFAHGGIAPTLAASTLAALDDTLAAYVGGDLFYHYADSTAVVRVDSTYLARWEDFFWGGESIFWYRDYVRADTLEPALREVLRRLGGSLHVVGHTPVHTIGERLGGALIAAHPARPALEMLLLAREPAGGWRRYRIGLEETALRF
jgi:hypothetical protein